MKILMVCLGNICRSPLAEGIMKHQLSERQLDWEVDSAGTSHWHVGERPDPRSISTAQQHGLDISHQQARQLQPEDLQDYDLILAMDQSNYHDVISLARKPEEREKVKTILSYVPGQSDQNVPDPYWDDNGFEQVYGMLEEACERVLEAHRTA